MATLQKFNLLATQCAIVSGSPTRSPVIHLHRRRRRKTLRMLLSRRPQSPIRNNNNNNSPIHQKKILINSPSSSSSTSTTSLKLKDFLLSTSPSESPERGRVVERVPRGGGGEGRVSFLRGSLRQRLMRKPFRPMLLTIPE